VTELTGKQLMGIIYMTTRFCGTQWSANSPAQLYTPRFLYCSVCRLFCRFDALLRICVQKLRGQRLSLVERVGVYSFVSSNSSSITRGAPSSRRSMLFIFRRNRRTAPVNFLFNCSSRMLVRSSPGSRDPDFSMLIVHNTSSLINELSGASDETTSRGTRDAGV
jgi:hypothetical protein